jgi:hypothetical protein
VRLPDDIGYEGPGALLLSGRPAWPGTPERPATRPALPTEAPPVRQMPAHGTVTRRAAIAGGVALAGTALLHHVPPSADGRLVIGANEPWFADLHQAVPAASCRRAYYGAYNYIPATWPVTADAASQSVSIRPVPSRLLSGHLDAQLKAFIGSAPPGSFLTAWHEAGNLAGYPSYINPRNMRAVHRYMNRLCQGTNVSYGPILCMHPDSMPPWLVPGLGWYGLDIYDWPEFHFPGGGVLDIHGRLWPRLTQWKAVIRKVSGQRNPELAICETNASQHSHRPKWMLAVAEWMAGNGGRRMLTYWSRAGVGPWLPQDRAVIAALRRCAQLLLAHMHQPLRYDHCRLAPRGAAAR